MKKKIIIPLIIVVFLIIIGVGLLFYINSMSNDRSAIENRIMQQYNDQSKITILGEKDIDNIKVIVFSRDNYIAKGILIKNILGRYEVFALASGTNRLFRCSIDKINDTFFLILLGKNKDNLDKAIIHISALDKDDKKVEFDKEVRIPRDNYFIIVEKMDNNLDYNNDFSDSTIFYNIDGKDVTKSLLTN